MRLLEEVITVVPGELVVAQRMTTAADFFFQGHFPGLPIVPAVILVELVAQAGGIAAAEGRPGRQLRVAAIGSFKFPDAAGPDMMLEVTARVAGRLGSLCKIEGQVTANGRLVASGELTLAG